MYSTLSNALPARSRGGKGEATAAVVSRQVFDYRSDVAVGRLAMIRQAIVSSANAGWGRFVAALHESRRKQGAIERARHQHLIYDADTGLHFGAHPAAGRSAAAARTQ
jgi:hypothetical protein